MTASPLATRAAYRAALAAVAAKTQAKIPALNGRVEKAIKLVLAGDVELQGTGALVHSQSDPAKTYTLAPGHCTCADYPRAPEHLCAHRLAAGFARKLAEMLPAPAPLGETAPPAPLPEAPASVNLKAMLHGHEVQLTLRDADETRLLARLAALVQTPGLRPLPRPAPRQQGQWRGKAQR